MYSVTELVTFVTVSIVLSKVLSTPVRASTASLPASFTSSKAPAKSPLNTFLTALPKKPKTSNADCNLSITFSLTARPKFFNDCTGSSKIALKYSVIGDILLSINLKKSLKASCKAENEVLKKSTTFWFSLNSSCIVTRPAITKPIPAALIAVPIALKPEAIPVKPLFAFLLTPPILPIELSDDLPTSLTSLSNPSTALLTLSTPFTAPLESTSSSLPDCFLH